MVMVGGIIGGLTLSECTSNSIACTDIIAAPGGNSGILGGGSFSEGGPSHSFLIDGCSLKDAAITTDAEDLEAAFTGELIGKAVNCQLADEAGDIKDITSIDIAKDQINSTVNVTFLNADGQEIENAPLIGQLIEE